MKKIICFVLTMVMIVSALALVSCAKDKDKIEGGEDPTPTGYEHPLLTSGLDFGGTEIRMVVASNDQSRSSIAAISVDVDEKTGEDLVDAIYDRNRLIEDTLNVDIQLIDVFGHTNFSQSVNSALASGDDEYDVFFAQQANDIDLCLQGFIVDLHNMNKYGNPVNHIQEDEEWWAGSYMDLYTYKNELFWLSGNVSMWYTGGIYSIFVNTNLYNRAFLETYGSIYDIVSRGEWTFDLMAEMSKKIYNDADASDTVTLGDTYGINLGGTNYRRHALLISAGLEGTVKNADGSLSWNIIHTNDKLLTLCQKVYGLFAETEGVTEETGVGEFSDGAVLFSLDMLNTLRSGAMREMTDDFAVIPTPKADMNQTEYRSAMHDNNHLIGLPYTNTRIQATTATLELMAYLSYYNVVPDYINEALKFKYTRDEQAAEMIDLIYASVYTDFGLIWEKWIFGSHWIRAYGVTQSPASLMVKLEENWALNLKETLARLDELSAEQNN